MPCSGRRVGGRVPEELRVVVRVRVDEPGRDHLTVGVDRALGVAGDLADGDDAPVVDGDVAGERLAAGPVDDEAALDDDVVGHATSVV